MHRQGPFDLESLSLTDIIRLQNQLSEVITKRFEKPLALVFSDIAGSTRYFTMFGNEAGQRLQQQHFDLLAEVIAGTDGKMIHTAGDGVMLTFQHVESAIDIIVKFRKLLWDLSCLLPADQQWTTRVGIHWGPVLTDGTVIAGDTVNLCSKISTEARPGAILLSKIAFSKLPGHLRSICRSIGPIPLGEALNSMELFRLSWHELFKLPIVIRVEETGEQIPLPDQPVITVGRLQSAHGGPSNNIVLRLPDDHRTNQISRWHLELRRQPDGLVICSLSDKPTHIDGRSVLKGETCAVTIGTMVRLSNVVTLQFLSLSDPEASTETTLARQTTTPASLTPKAYQ